MNRRHPARLARRAFLQAWLAVSAPLLLIACNQKSESERTTGATGPSPSSPPAEAAAATAAPTQARSAATPAPASPPAQAQLRPTPACGDDDDPTPAQTEGPYFTPNSPERASLLEPGMSGTRLTLTGYVLTAACRPVARTLVDFWQCDDKGVYDNTGYRLRGHQFTDAAGRYSLETIVPALYPGRTRHIHVKVQAPNRPVLTTQLYFPGEARNRADGIFNPALVMDLQDTTGGKAGAYNFVLNL
jgi:protocatechuate 3,4-dioxygenase beta subunit